MERIIFSGHWDFCFSNYELVKKFIEKRNMKNKEEINRMIKIFNMVEGTFVIVKPDDIDDGLYPKSGIDAKYKFYLRYAYKMEQYDIIVGYNEIDVYHFESCKLRESHPFRRIFEKFVYVPYIPQGIYHRSKLNITKENRDIDVLTLFTTSSLREDRDERPRRKILNKMRENNFVLVNLSDVKDPGEMAKYFARSKIIVHVTQLIYSKNHAEISLLPALAHGVLVVSEKCAIYDSFAYSKFIIWTDVEVIIDMIKIVLSNYEIYFNRIQKGMELSKTLDEIEEQAENNFNKIMDKVI